jgi:hypothetical protein
MPPMGYGTGDLDQLAHNPLESTNNTYGVRIIHINNAGKFVSVSMEEFNLPEVSDFRRRGYKIVTYKLGSEPIEDCLREIIAQRL